MRTFWMYGTIRPNQGATAGNSQGSSGTRANTRIHPTPRNEKC